jgi:putative flavoprotein involved in K+ transport
MDDIIDVVVVGAGQAGLAVSYLLKRSGVQHVVLERGRIGESWRSQRWDSFYLNTPNWGNGLPGSEFHPEAPNVFCSRDQLVSYFERYVRSSDLPVRQHTTVNALEKHQTGEYTLRIEGDKLRARAVVLATGGLSRPKMPNVARRLSSEIVSLSAGTYKNVEALPAGGVVVVGSGQSGCQIAEELLSAGRCVYLCASRVGRAPRVYRGRDIMAWFRDMGIFDVRVDQLEDPSIQFAAQPQVSGTNGGHTVSLQSLARDGATLLGRVLDVDGSILKLGSNLRGCIEFADNKSNTLKANIDAFINREGIQATAPEPDSGEPALPDLKGSDRLDTLNLQSAGVGSVIWCTGFDADWSWLKIDVFDERGQPRHQNGITDSPGLYVTGLPWLTKRKSGILYGVTEDAIRIVEHIERHVLISETV